MTATPGPNSIGLFDGLAHGYDQLAPMFATFGEKLVALMGPEPGTDLLDIGTGRGAVAVAALKRGATVVAVDASPKMTHALKRDHPNVPTQVMDAHCLGFAAQVFDMAAAAFVIHVVEDPSRVLAEARRVLRPDGLLALTTPGPIHDSWAEYFALFGRFRPRPDAAHIAQPVDVEALLKEAGFRELGTATIEIDLPVASAETLWSFEMSHGFAGYVRSLAVPDQQRLKREASSLLDGMEQTGGIRLRRIANVYTGHTPMEDPPPAGRASGRL